MKVCLATVIYPNDISLNRLFIDAVKKQDYLDFDIIIVNDNAMKEQIDIFSELSNRKIFIDSEGSGIAENRVKLIKKATNQGYDLLIWADSDDAFSSNRISAYVQQYDSKYCFFYNNLIYNEKNIFRHPLPLKIDNYNFIKNYNYIGLSHSGINLKSIDINLLNKYNYQGVIAFDWFLYSVLLLNHFKGKFIDGCQTYYSVYDDNISVICKNNLSVKNLMKTMKIRICHYSALYDKHIFLGPIISESKNILTSLKINKRYYYKMLKYYEEKNFKLYWWEVIEREDNMNFWDYILDENTPPYVIAEIGSNHNGDMDLAKRLILSAKECGANAVKFQSWTDESLISKEEYQNNQSYDDSPKKHFGSLEQMVKKYYLREEQHHMLSNFCKEHEIEFCSTPFSTDEVDLLMDLEVPFFKIASMDVTNHELLRYVAKQNKPILLSTGMATLSEIEQAVKIFEDENNFEYIILHCVSIYPPKIHDINLNNIKMLSNTFECPVGFSDHTIGTSVPIASVVLGSKIIEKHFTLDKSLEGWDHEISADPKELSYICEESKNVFHSLGSYKRIVSDEEQEKKKKFRRSIVINSDLKKGSILEIKDLEYKRPGNYIAPNENKYVVGRKLNKDLSKDSVLRWDDLE